MTDETLMLDEDETLALLRAGRTGTEPPLTDVTAIAIAHARRRRLRRRAGQTAGALILATAAAVAVVAGAPGLTRGAQPVIQPADRGTQGSEDVTGAEVNVRNEQLLAAALGPDFRVSLTGTEPQFAAVELVPGSPADQRLPDAYTATTEIEIAPVFTQVDDPCNPRDPAAATGTCEHRTLDDGSEVLISTVRSENDDYFAAATNAYFVRPDKQVARVTMSAYPTDKNFDADAPTRASVLTWVRSYANALATAATDPRLSIPPAVAQTSEARYQDERNLEYLGEALGQNWKREKGKGNLVAENAARDGLPSAYVGHASVMVSPGELPIEEICTQTRQQGSTCDLRSLPDGRKVVVQATPVQYLQPGDLYTAYSSFSVAYVQPDTGFWVTATLSAHGVDVSEKEPAAIRERVTAWLAGFESLLSRAATDSRMAVDTENH